jgi:predicted DsbA family dithiol-disulfide isomerase
VQTEIYADVLCPWCYIGKRRISRALATIENPPQITWRSFELAPEATRTPGPTAAEAMTQWWGDKAAARVAQIQAIGKAEGLELNMGIACPASTFDAHRLIHLAGDHGAADRAWERLLRAYHTEGRNIADPATLRDLAEELDLEPLTSDDYAEAVRADERKAKALGVTGVPSLVIGDGPPVSAVQPVADLRRLLSP